MWHGNFCKRMAAMSGKQLGIGKCTGRTDNTQENTKQEYLLLQEYCIPVKMSMLFLPRCQKWPKSLLVQVSEATVKPPQSLFFQTLSSGATSHHKESFPAPATSLPASAPAPSLAATVLEPSNHCFLLQGSLSYGGQEHTVTWLGSQ